MMNYKNLAVIFFVLLFTISSCKKDKQQDKVESYYPSGNIKSIIETNEERKPVKETIFYDSITQLPFQKIFRNYEHQYDSLVWYYNNGNVYKVYNRDFNKQIFGDFFKYTREGYLSTKREYFIIKDSSVLNRRWYFDREGDTMWYGRKFNRY